MAVKDPVCRMSLGSADAAETIDHDRKTYYFCSKDCAEEFRNVPESYTLRGGGEADEGVGFFQSA